MTPLARFLDLQAARRPRSLALTGAARLTFAALRARSLGIGQALMDQGVRAGDVVAVALPSPRALALAAFGCARLGAALFPLDPRLPQARLRALAEAVNPEHVIAHDGVSAAFDGLGARVPDSLLDAEPRGRAVGAVVESDPEAPALLIATSGSQGEPRAVMLAGRSLVAGAAASAARIPLAPGDAWIACLPLFHVGGMSILYRCARAGAAVSLHEGFESAAVLEELAAGRATHVSLVPTMLARLLDAAGGLRLPARVRCLLVGGAGLPPALAAKALDAGWPVFVSYGLSEAASQVATVALDAAWRPGHVGRPLEGVTVETVDEAGRRTGGVGRLRIAGPMLMAGYANPRRAPGAGLDNGALVSGDLGRIEADGTLTVLGRADDLMVTGGEKVHPVQVEMTLADCPGVRDVGVSAAPDPVWGERLVAFVVGSADPAALERWCRERMPPAWRPQRFVRVTALPRNALQKIERGALRRMARENAGGAAA